MGLNSQLMVDNQKRARASLFAQTIESKMEEVGESDLTKIRGVGEVTAEKLFNVGIKTARQLKNRKYEELEWTITNPIALLALKRFLEKEGKNNT